jgi:hypothetical protein
MFNLLVQPPVLCGVMPGPEKSAKFARKMPHFGQVAKRERKIVRCPLNRCHPPALACDVCSGVHAVLAVDSPLCAVAVGQLSPTVGARPRVVFNCKRKIARCSHASLQRLSASSRPPCLRSCRLVGGYDMHPQVYQSTEADVRTNARTSCSSTCMHCASRRVAASMQRTCRRVAGPRLATGTSPRYDATDAEGSSPLARLGLFGCVIPVIRRVTDACFS